MDAARDVVLLDGISHRYAAVALEPLPEAQPRVVVALDRHVEDALDAVREQVLDVLLDLRLDEEEAREDGGYDELGECILGRGRLLWWWVLNACEHGVR